LHVYHLANLLAGDGHSVEVICSGDAHKFKLQAPRPGEYPHHPGVTVHRIKSGAGRLEPMLTYLFGTPVFTRRRLKRLLEQDYDVIHYHNISLFGGISILNLGRGIKLFTQHTYWLFCPTHYQWKNKREVCEKKECLSCLLSYRRPPQFWRYRERMETRLRPVDSLIMPCKFMIEEHRREGFKGRMDCLPYFVEPVEKAAAADLEKEFGHLRPFFLVVTRLESYKGPQVAVSAFKKKKGAAGLVIVGTGSRSEYLRKLAGGDPHIYFLNYVAPDRLDWLYQNAVALLAPSVWPEMGNQTVLQAESCGTPVIAAGNGCLPELVEEHGSGIIFHDEAELLRAMERMEDPDVRSGFVPKAQAAYQNNYTPRIFLDRYYRLIEELR